MNTKTMFDKKPNNNRQSSHDSSSSSINNNDINKKNNNDQRSNNQEEIYSYYKNQLLPAIFSSLPLLCHQIIKDVGEYITARLTSLLYFLIPWLRHDFHFTLSGGSSGDAGAGAGAGTIGHNHGLLPLWIQSKQENFTQFLLHHLDSNQDGHISPSELLKLDLLSPSPSSHFPPSATTTTTASIPSLTNMFIQCKSMIQSSFHWFQYTFPLMDWKIGIFVWKSCGKLLLLIALFTIVPGRIHVWSGRFFRWPILLLTYVMIASELLVYILVRLFIFAAEQIFSTTKHRKLRNALLLCETYAQWKDVATQLDISMGRNEWQYSTQDDFSQKYNWVFINELIADLKKARCEEDVMLALVVLRQCTRKNVGGVMNEDLFSFTNTGEPKIIVKEFLDEVVMTLQWLTEKSRLKKKKETKKAKMLLGNNNEENVGTSRRRCQAEEEFVVNVKTKVDKEDEHVHNVLHIMDHVIGPVSWALKSVLGQNQHHDANVNDNDHDNYAEQQQDKTQQATARDLQSLQKKSNDDHECINDNDKNDDQDDRGGEDENSVDFLEASSVQHNSFVSTEKFAMQEREQVKTFLKRARAAYGRTALCLSGGGMMGCYHFGAIKALLEENVLPHIISGTSAGSAAAALVCTRTDEEIKRDLCPEILSGKMTCFARSWPDRLRCAYSNGYLFDKEEWISLIEWFTCGDLTFEEAYKKTGRILCITVSATTMRAPPVLLNYITAPDVTIASAIVASAAVPGFVEPVVLNKKGQDGVVREQGKNKDEAYWDGSIDQDIPKNGLSEMFNCQFFLASQCNPHIVPFFHNSQGCVAQPSRWTNGKSQDSWRGGFLLAALEMYLKGDMKAKFVFLDELGAAISFTSTMMTQQQYGGTTTIIPQVSLSDYFVLFSNPSIPFLKKCFQRGSIAAYQHCAIMKHHYRVAHALDECLAVLEEEDGSLTKPRRRLSQLASNINGRLGVNGLEARQRAKGFSINTSVLPDDTDDSTAHDDECESGGFDGVKVVFNHKYRIKEKQAAE